MFQNKTLTFALEPNTPCENLVPLYNQVNLVAFMYEEI